MPDRLTKAHRQLFRLGLTEDRSVKRLGTAFGLARANDTPMRLAALRVKGYAGYASAGCGRAADVGALLGDAGLLEADAGEGRDTGTDVVLGRQREAESQMGLGLARVA